MKYILTNVNIINGISESLIKGKSVVVKDDIIEDITEDILAYKDYKIIDLKNKYLMPGLINLHVHLPWLAADYKLHIKSLKKYSIIPYFFLVLLYNINKEWWHFYV